jgi:MarR family 2-MHQ and catechol resistance regulon transcriptional repressor
MRKGFDNPAHEALLNIYYTASRTRKKAGEFFRLQGLTDVQFNVLSLLKHQSGENGGLTQVELSRMMLVNRANITTLIDRMEKADLVARKPVPDDRRYNIIELTAHGVEMYHKVSGVYKKKITEIMNVLGDEELTNLINTLEKIRLNLDQVGVD